MFFDMKEHFERANAGVVKGNPENENVDHWDLDNILGVLSKGEILDDRVIFNLLGIEDIGSCIYEYKRIVRERDVESRYEFNEKLFGVDVKIRSILWYQIGNYFKRIYNSLCEDVYKGKILNCNDMNFIIKMEVYDNQRDKVFIDELCKEYKYILEKEDKDNIKVNEGINKVLFCSPVLKKAFMNCKSLNKLHVEARNGLKIPDEYDYSCKGKAFYGNYIEFLLNMIPGISPGKICEILEKYRCVMRETRLEYIMFFIADLEKMGVCKKICDVFLYQFENEFINKYFSMSNDGKILNNNDMRVVFNGIREISPTEVSELYKDYISVITERNEIKGMCLMRELTRRGVNDKIWDIVFFQFNNLNIMIPLTRGNLVVHKSAKHAKHESKHNKFNYMKPVDPNPSKRVGRSLFREFFYGEIVNPIRSCQEELPRLLLGGVEESIRNEYRDIFGEELTEDVIKDITKALTSNVLGKSLEKIEEKLPYLEERMIEKSSKTRRMDLDDYSIYESEDKKECNLLKIEIRKLLPNSEFLMSLIKCMYLRDLYKNKIPLAESPFFDFIFREKGFAKDFKTFKLYAGKTKDKIAQSISESILLPIFSHPPCTSDIQQGKTADCYFLAALISLINSSEYGPNYIMGMMRNIGLGIVKVDYHKINYARTGMGDLLTEERDITVNKESLSSNTKSALWVRVLERAYVITGGNLWDYELYDDGSEYDETTHVRTMYDIKSGRECLAFIWLTGRMSYSYSDTCMIIRENRDINPILATDEELSCFIEEKMYKNYPITISFKENFKGNEGFDFRERHAYSIVGITEDNGKKSLELINPWHGDKIISCPIQDLRLHVNTIDVLGN